VARRPQRSRIDTEAEPLGIQILIERHKAVIYNLNVREQEIDDVDNAPGAGSWRVRYVLQDRAPAIDATVELRSAI
jgi:hypothetical protein